MMRRMGAALLLAAATGHARTLEPETGWRPDLPGRAARIWIGPEFFANRLQDWRLEDGSIVCVEGRSRFPARTCHILPLSSDGEGPARLQVEIDLAAAGPPARDALAGFLIGCGGKEIDPRLSAMTHHRPAEDGGMVVAVGADGRVAMRDFSGGSPGAAAWGIGGPLAEGDLPEVAGFEVEGPEKPEDVHFPVRLRVDWKKAATGGGVVVTATSRDANGSVLSRGRATVDRDLVEGSMALFSHLGAESRGFRFRDVSAAGVSVHPERAFGPVLSALHTVSAGDLHLTAQMGPLGDADQKTARLELKDEEGTWRVAARSALDDDSYTFRFRVPGIDLSRDTPYRVVYALATGSGATETHYSGTIRREPAGPEFTIAAFTGHKVFTGGLRWNHRGIWFPHDDIVKHVGAHDPDFLFFSGDQVYEGDLTPAVHRPEDQAILDYLYKWYRWCWAFRDLARDRPSVTIPDDHDVYHGNIWGAGGVATSAEGMGQAAQDSGGYKMSARFVNAVHRTQVSHLPESDDPAPIARGITSYFTRIEYAGISFAVLADRMFKSSPTVMVPEGKCRNGWFQAEGFDPKTQSDVPGAVLLGERQLAFLNRWATDWSHGAWMKVALSQTIFANVATLPRDAKSDAVVPSLPYPAPDEYPPDDVIAADADSNGWPKSGRDRALRELRRGFALHIAGDQHLGSTIRYGIDDWGDAGYALCVPSIANTWPRRWFPPHPGGNHREGQPRYTGDYEDGFGNKITVLAVSNPRKTTVEPVNLHSRMPGYGIVRLRRDTRRIEVANWPRHEDPTRPGARPYPGWPIAFQQEEGYNRRASGWLPAIVVEGMRDPVIRVIDEATQEAVYAIRIRGAAFRPRVFTDSSFTVEVGEPGTARWKRLEHLLPARVPAGAIEVAFE